MFSAAHDLKMEWVIIKGISDYADGTASLTQHWKAFASVMAASVVNNMLQVPVVFDDWPHYQTHDVRRGTPRGAMNTLSTLEVPVSTLIFLKTLEFHRPLRAHNMTKSAHSFLPQSINPVTVDCLFCLSVYLTLSSVILFLNIPEKNRKILNLTTVSFLKDLPLPCVPG